MASRLSLEQKMTDRLHESVMRMDFDTGRFARFIHTCGIRTQMRVFDTFISLVRHLAIDYDADEWTRVPREPHSTQAERDAYYNMLCHAKRIQETLNL